MENITETFEQFEKLISKTHEIIKICNNSNYDNIFTSISDTFYHENFHSDILCYILKNDDAKKEFVKWINQALNLKINFDIYKGGEVQREEKHRDITLYSKNKKNVIIVESKSNGANDRDKQILGYIETLEKCETNKINVDVVLYINKYSYKEPEHHNWNEQYNKYKNKILIATLLDKNSIAQLLDNIISNTNDKKIIGISLELKDLFSLIVKGKMREEMSKIRDIINASPIRKYFLEFLKYEDNFAYLFENEYFSDICAFKDDYNLNEIDRWDDKGRNVIYIDFMKDNVLISIDIDFKKTLYSISVIPSSREEKKNKENIDVNNKKVENLIKKYNIEYTSLRNKTSERQRFCLIKKQSAFEKEELLYNLKKILDTLELNLNKKA